MKIQSFLFSIILLVGLAQCNKITPEQSKSANDADSSSIASIECYLPESPFELIFKPIAKFPDSLGGHDVRGKMVIYVVLDSTCAIEQLKIPFLIIKNKAGNILFESRINESEHQKKLQRYESWARKYAQEIVFRRKKETKYTRVWLGIPLSLNDEDIFQQNQMKRPYAL